MATCRECLHFETCLNDKQQTKYYGVKEACNNVQDLCRYFLSKSDYVKRERGEWIVKEKHQTALSGSYIYKVKSYYCQSCKKRFGRRMKFCGECGADMRKEDNNER